MSAADVNVRRRRAARVLTTAPLIVVLGLASACSSGSGDDRSAGSAPAVASSSPAGSTSASTPNSSQPAGAPGNAPSGPPTAVKPSSAATPARTAASTAAPAAAKVALPPPGAKFDYQIGAAYPPPAGVRIVSRDSSAAPVAGLYNICYLNAFQAQADATSWWQANHPDLLLRDKSGALVVDQDWNEAVLDVSSAAKRAALAQVEDPWIDACARKGFQAVEADNLDSHSRSAGLLTPADDVEFAKLIAAHAHGLGLAIAQKNATELLDQRKAVGFDFAVAEQCGSFDECAQYAAAYADHVVDVEYDAAGFGAACKAFGTRLSIVRRDRDVSAPGGGTYVFQSC